MVKIKEIAERTVDSIKNFTKNPIENLGLLIPFTMILVSFISAFIGYIFFIVHDGYSNQISSIKELGFDGIDQVFSSGSSRSLISGNIPKILGILFLIQMVVMLISYFRNAGKTKIIIMAIDLVILAMVIALFPIVAGSLFMAPEQFINAFIPFEGITIDLKKVLITYAVFAGSSFIVFLILILISKCRWMLGYALRSLIMDFIIMPLGVLLLENIIPLATMIGFVAVVGGVILFIFKVLLAGTGADTVSTNNSSSSNVSPKMKPTEKQQYQKIEKIDITTTFWRDKGGSGFVTPTGDCIYYKNNIDAKAYVCTVYDFETGKVAIMYKGSRVMNIAGCKTPER